MIRLILLKFRTRGARKLVDRVRRSIERQLPELLPVERVLGGYLAQQPGQFAALETRKIVRVKKFLSRNVRSHALSNSESSLVRESLLALFAGA